MTMIHHHENGKILKEAPPKHVCLPPGGRYGPYSAAGSIWLCNCGQHWLVKDRLFGTGSYWLMISAKQAKKLL
jgi:hypothetical protein